MRRDFSRAPSPGDMRTTTALLALTLALPACIELSDDELSDEELSETEQSVQLPLYSITDTTVSSTGADTVVRANCPVFTVALGSSWIATDLAGSTIDTVVASASARAATPPRTPPGSAWVFLAHSTTGAPYNIRVRLVCGWFPGPRRGRVHQGATGRRRWPPSLRGDVLARRRSAKSNRGERAEPRELRDELDAKRTVASLHLRTLGSPLGIVERELSFIFRVVEFDRLDEWNERLNLRFPRSMLP